MKILLVLENYPYARGEAVEVVVHEVIRLIAEAGHRIDVQVILRAGKKFSPDMETKAMEGLRFENIGWLPPMEMDQFKPKSFFSPGTRRTLVYLRHLLGLPTKPSPALFPSLVVAPRIQEIVDREGYEALLSVWSYVALPAMFAVVGAKKLIYYGDPDHLPVEMRLNHPEFWGDKTGTPVTWWKGVVARFKNRVREEQHVYMMNRCELEVNNSLVDARYYTKKGHPCSVYLQNMWCDANRPPSYTHAVSRKPFRIAASVGFHKATGNTMAFHYLGAEVLPRLIRLFGDEEFVLDVYGKGPAHPPAQKLLEDDHFRLHGWVDDLDAELTDSSCFLCLNSAHGFIVGNTRILLAWSLGVPVVAHSNSALSMPEMVHGDSTLMGSDADEVAQQIYEVCVNDELRRRIGEGGYRAYRKYYRSEIVVPKMISLMERMLAGEKIEAS